MQTRALLAIGIGLAIACSTWADEVPDAAQLGSFEGMLTFCSEINPPGKSAYDRLRETMIGNQPEGAVEALTQTPEYRQAYEAARQKSAAEPHEKVLKECTQLAAALSPRLRHGNRHN